MVSAHQTAHLGLCDLRRKRLQQPPWWQAASTAPAAATRLVEVRAEQDDGGGEAHQRGQAQDHLVKHSLVVGRGRQARAQRQVGKKTLQEQARAFLTQGSKVVTVPSRTSSSPHSFTHLGGRDLRKVEGAGGQRAKGQEAQRLAQAQVAPPAAQREGRRQWGG